MTFAPFPQKPLRVSDAFTLIELLTVIAIIGVLAGIMLPVLGTVRESARVTHCQSNLRQIFIALMMFVDDNKGKLPGKLTGAQPSRYSTNTNQNNALATHLVFSPP